MKQCSKNIMHLIVLSPIHKMILVSILIPLSIVKWNFTTKIKYTRKSIYFSIQFPKSTLQHRSRTSSIHYNQSFSRHFSTFYYFFSFISISIRRFYKLTESRPVDRNDSITRRNNTRSQMEREGRGRGRGERTQLMLNQLLREYVSACSVSPVIMLRARKFDFRAGGACNFTRSDGETSGSGSGEGMGRGGGGRERARQSLKTDGARVSNF